jgi:glycine/D-amino acid oxidase-like deaminating enzyme
MILRAGYPYSLVKNGLPVDYPKLEKDARTDVLVMGGGISGALAAHYLVSEGIDCILVDGRTIGLGSTCASTSLLQYEIDTPLHQLIAMVGKEPASFRKKRYHDLEYSRPLSLYAGHAGPAYHYRGQG